MFEAWITKRYLILMTVVPALLALTACGSSGDEASPLAEPSATIEETAVITDESVVITIGNLTDITGPGAGSVAMVDMALEDMAAYYNENNLIPGVELEVIKYDAQMDPARDIPGYEWLREKGADFIFSPVPGVPSNLKPRADKDEVVLFAVAASKEGILPPGYVFNLGVDPQHEAYTLLKWIAENDWNYQTKGPAKVGGAAWAEPYSETFIASMEEYCSAHPDQFEWNDGFLTGFTFTWEPEIEALKDCDYVYPGVVMTSFVKQYREAGHTEAKFVSSDASAAFLGTVEWDGIDGMLFVKYPRWWNEDGEIINLAKQLVYENHPDDAESIIRSGNAYLAVNQAHAMFCIIANAVKAVGPEHFNSQALYEAATSFTYSCDGVQRVSFNDEKRNATDSYAIYEARATEEDIFRMHDEWIPAVRNP